MKALKTLPRHSSLSIRLEEAYGALCDNTSACVNMAGNLITMRISLGSSMDESKVLLNPTGTRELDGEESAICLRRAIYTSPGIIRRSCRYHIPGRHAGREDRGRNIFGGPWQANSDSKERTLRYQHETEIPDRRPSRAEAPGENAQEF